MNQSVVDRSRARQVAIFSSMLVVVIFSPITANAGESNNCCEDPDKFDLFLIGDPDNGQLTPFESDLEERKSVEVTSSLLGEVEIGSWMIEWGEAGSYSSGTWTFSIPYGNLKKRENRGYIFG